MNELLITVSVYSVWSAVALYVLAFAAFAADLAGRASHAESGAASPYRSGLAARLGVVLSALGLALHLVAIITRGVAAGRVPWDNLFGYALVSTAVVVAVYLALLFWVDLRYIGTFITGLVTVLLGGASAVFYVGVTAIDPALRSPWLVFHVFVAALGLGLFGVGFALSTVQLLRERRRFTERSASRASRLLDTLPSADRLETLAYRVNIIGFVFWTFTLIAGAIWAEAAWGRFWGWDVKETWTFIIWVIYAGYIHARATRGWRGARSAWLSIIGFAAVIFNTTVVNTLFKGLHSYSGLSG